MKSFKLGKIEVKPLGVGVLLIQVQWSLNASVGAIREQSLGVGLLLIQVQRSLNA